MKNLSDMLASALTERGVDLLRLASGEYRTLLDALESLERELVGKLAGKKPLTDYGKARLNSLLDDVRSTITDVYTEIASDHEALIRGLAQQEAKATAFSVNNAVGAEIIDGVVPRSFLRSLATNVLIQGAPSGSWWEKQAGHLMFQFAAAVRTGIISGETNDQITQRARDVIDVSRRDAQSLVRTSVQTVANQSRMEVFKANDDVIKGVQQVSTLDDRTTEICMAYDGQTWTLEGEPMGDTELPFNGGPPRHWNCRSVLVPITVSWEELGMSSKKEVDLDVRARMDGKPASIATFGDWLEGKSKERVNEILGPGRADLWREGKIGMTDLLDQSGRPLTLAELRSKHGE